MPNNNLFNIDIDNIESILAEANADLLEKHANLLNKISEIPSEISNPNEAESVQNLLAEMKSVGKEWRTARLRDGSPFTDATKIVKKWFGHYEDYLKNKTKNTNQQLTDFAISQQEEIEEVVEEEEEDRWVEEEEETPEYIPPVSNPPYWNYRFTDSMYQDSMYDGTNRVRGTFSTSNTTASPANTSRQIYTQLPFIPGTGAITVAQVAGSELPAGLSIIKPAGYDHVEIYGTLPTVSELTTYNFELEIANAAGTAQQQFTFYVDESGASRVTWRDPTAYSDNLSAQYFSYNEAVDITLEASTTNTTPPGNKVKFVSTPNPPLSWLAMQPVTIQSQEIIDGVYQYENVQNDILDTDPSSATYNLMIPETQLDMEYGSETYEQLIPVYTSEPKMVTSTVLDKINLTGTTPDDLAVYTDFTFDVRAYEKGADLDNLTAEQYNDKEFVYRVSYNPGCVTPAVYDCPGT